MELKMSAQSRGLISIYEDTVYSSELQSITSGWVGVRLMQAGNWKNAGDDSAVWGLKVTLTTLSWLGKSIQLYLFLQIVKNLEKSFPVTHQFTLLSPLVSSFA